MEYSYFTLLYFTLLSIDGGGCGNGGTEIYFVCFLFVFCFFYRVWGSSIRTEEGRGYPVALALSSFFFPGAPFSNPERGQGYNITTTYLLRLALSFIIYHLSNRTYLRRKA